MTVIRPILLYDTKYRAIKRLFMEDKCSRDAHISLRCAVTLGEIK